MVSKQVRKCNDELQDDKVWHTFQWAERSETISRGRSLGLSGMLTSRQGTKALSWLSHTFHMKQRQALKISGQRGDIFMCADVEHDRSLPHHALTHHFLRNKNCNWTTLHLLSHFKHWMKELQTEFHRHVHFPVFSTCLKLNLFMRVK